MHVLFTAVILQINLLWSALYNWMNVEMAHKNSLPSATILKCYFNRVKVHAGRLSTTKPSIFIVYLLLCGPESFQSESKQTCISKLICRCFCYFLATLSSSSSWSWSSTWITTYTTYYNLLRGVDGNLMCGHSLAGKKKSLAIVCCRHSKQMRFGTVEIIRISDVTLFWFRSQYV